MWETTCVELTELKKRLEQKRGSILSKNLIIKEALQLLKEKEAFL
jgi:hypothetical protein